MKIGFVILCCIMVTGCSQFIAETLLQGVGSNVSHRYRDSDDKQTCLQYIKSPQPHQKKENWDLVCDKYGYHEQNLLVPSGDSKSCGAYCVQEKSSTSNSVYSEIKFGDTVVKSK